MEYKYKTFEFPETANGQVEKLKKIDKMEAEGWELVSETVQPASMDRGAACLMFIICLPLIFFTFNKSKIILTFRRPDE